MSESDVVLMWCEDGHTWINQGDGTVSPSWGLGGTHMPVADPRVCPEPDRDEDGRTDLPVVRWTALRRRVRSVLRRG